MRHAEIENLSKFYTLSLALPVVVRALVKSPIDQSCVIFHSPAVLLSELFKFHSESFNLKFTCKFVAGEIFPSQGIHFTFPV